MKQMRNEANADKTNADEADTEEGDKEDNGGDNSCAGCVIDRGRQM